MSFGLPHQVINLLKYFMNSLDVKFSTSSESTALLTLQVTKKVLSFDPFLDLVR